MKIFINFFEKILGSVSKKSESRVGARPKRRLVFFQKSFALPFPFLRKVVVKMADSTKVTDVSVVTVSAKVLANIIGVGDRQVRNLAGRRSHRQ